MLSFDEYSAFQTSCAGTRVTDQFFGIDLAVVPKNSEKIFGALGIIESIEIRRRFGRDRCIVVGDARVTAAQSLIDLTQATLLVLVERL